ncbi:hypothetical protein G7Z17_g13342 [Cylindrodendrum hubeiense]|uniref:ATP-dependent DNA helicase n=1 Tax=Cylindrodendrum hubeiense TaxID=595255 RepID=A0A9P5L2C2_9HYPO|nr:hypothetical protein G7Z17_g13342 [Cylindrodendrum hubeiense]
MLDEIHVSWHGPEKPTPADLSKLLSVRRRVVERALLWLKACNPLYADVRIDEAELGSWEEPTHGVPRTVYDRIIRDEPSAWEVARTAQIVPPSERGLGGQGGATEPEIADIVSELETGPAKGSDIEGVIESWTEASRDEAEAAGAGGFIDEISVSGMFSLDAGPGGSDSDKLQFLVDRVRANDLDGLAEVDGSSGSRYSTRGYDPRASEGHFSTSATVSSLDTANRDKTRPYVHLSRGGRFADLNDLWFWAKTFPTLFPFGLGGPRCREESGSDVWQRRRRQQRQQQQQEQYEVEGIAAGQARSADEDAVESTRPSNMGLRAWANVVLQRHGGRFASHQAFAFLVFNIDVRSRNRAVSMISVKRPSFAKVERVVQSLTQGQLESAKTELESASRTTDPDINQLLRSLSLYGQRQPMSREARLSLRKKIKSMMLRFGIPGIWFTLNPNDITNPVKLQLAAFRQRDPEAAEALLQSLDGAFKRIRLAISDPLSSAIFFYREIGGFFEHYVRTGKKSVFGCIGQYFAAVETNERGALHLHGLMWHKGNLDLMSSIVEVGAVVADEAAAAAYRDRILSYVDSVFVEDFDESSFRAVRAERSGMPSVAEIMTNRDQLRARFDEEANFCAGTSQIHTHSPTCVKYSVGRLRGSEHSCRFKAPWSLVEKTMFTTDGVLRLQRSHRMINRWNKAIAIGLRHNHDISFIGTQSKTMSLVYYLTNYTTKVEDPVWKRAAVTAELLPTFQQAAEPAGATSAGKENRARQFLMRVANRIFTDRALSHVEVIANLMGYPSDFSSVTQWSYVNVTLLYWYVFRRWPYLRRARDSNGDGDSDRDDDGSHRDVNEEAGGPAEVVMLGYGGRRLSFFDAYLHRGPILREVCFYDYVSLVQVQRAEACRGSRIYIPLDPSWLPGLGWVQVLRRPGQAAVVCFDGFLDMEFSFDQEQGYYRRATVQHLGLFVPWESFLSDSDSDSGPDINCIWDSWKARMGPRLTNIVDNIQLLKRSAEDAKRDAKQWAAMGEGPWVGDDAEGDGTIATDFGDDDRQLCRTYRAGTAGDIERLIGVFRGAAGPSQITKGSGLLLDMLQQLRRFQAEAADADADTDSDSIAVALLTIEGNGDMSVPQGLADLPQQGQLKSIKSQQNSISREIERRIQGIQGSSSETGASGAGAALAIAGANSEVDGFGSQGARLSDAELRAIDGPSATVCFAPSMSFLAIGQRLAEVFTLNHRQRIAFLLICRQLDAVEAAEAARQSEGSEGTAAAAAAATDDSSNENAGSGTTRPSNQPPQLCEFVGGEGGTGKSRVIEAIAALFEGKGAAHRLLVTATSGTAAARINGVTIHSACRFSKDQSRARRSADAESEAFRSSQRQVDGATQIDWREKWLLIVDEVSMLGARTLYNVNEQLCRLRGCADDFGGVPLVLFSGDFHQFRPVQERSMLIPSHLVAWGNTMSGFTAEQRHQHDRAHALWLKFTTVILLDEQVRAAGDPDLLRLLRRVRQGIQDASDVNFLNARCFREGRPIPWESGVTVVTPLNRNRWNLNLEATLAFQHNRKTYAPVRLFLSEHRWLDGAPSEEEAAAMLAIGDDSAVPVPALFMYVPGMPVVVNQNIHQGLKLVNGASYTAVGVVPNEAAFPGRWVSPDALVHFGPPAGLLLSSEATATFAFVGMPPGTILLTPLSTKISRSVTRRPWQQHDVSRRGLPCTAAFACTDYKVQGRTLARVALELRGTRTARVNGETMPGYCDPYSLYVQLSRCPTLDGITLLSKVRMGDMVGNTIPGDMMAAEERLQQLCQETIEAAEASGLLL